MKPNVLITGATAGIGYELTKLFAADGYGLALVARDEKRLDEFADQLRSQYQITIRIVPKDLSEAHAGAAVFDALKDFPISILVNNAGSGVYGTFADSNLDAQLKMLHLNMLSLVELTHLFLEPMRAKRDGKILNVASTAAFQPSPKLALYAASKAFVYSFSNALSIELEGSGISVTTLSPGLTKSEFHVRAGMQRTKIFRSGFFKPMTAESVARIGYEALLKSKPDVVAGFMNALMVTVSKCLPARLTGRIAGKLNENR